MINHQPILAPWYNDIYEKQEYRLVQDFSIEVNGLSIDIPEGFGYDGATIPSFAWQVIYTPFDPIMMMPALVHDWLYTTHYQMKRHEDADDVLVELCSQNGVSYAKCATIGAAVKSVGQFFWEMNERDRLYLAQLRQYITKTGRNPDDYHIPNA